MRRAPVEDARDRPALRQLRQRLAGRQQQEADDEFMNGLGECYAGSMEDNSDGDEMMAEVGSVTGEQRMGVMSWVCEVKCGSVRIGPSISIPGLGLSATNSEEV